MSRTTEPTCVTQGEQIEWTRDFCDYPADEWTLEYRFRGPGTGVNIDATADGTKFAAVLTSVASAALAAGEWRWQAWATNIAEPTTVQMIDSGTTQILTGFVDSTAEVDLRSDAEKHLAAIDAALLAFAESDVLEYEIETPAGRRKVKRSDKTTLESQRKYWAGIVANEKLKRSMKNGGPFAKPIRARMYER
jgi:hypothetical protein